MPPALAALVPAITSMATAGIGLLKAREAKKEAAQQYDQNTTSQGELENAMMEDPTRKPDFGINKSSNIVFPTNPLNIKKRPQVMGG